MRMLNGKVVEQVRINATNMQRLRLAAVRRGTTQEAVLNEVIDMALGEINCEELSGPAIFDALTAAGQDISERTCYNIASGQVMITVDKLAALAPSMPWIATWRSVEWFAKRHAAHWRREAKTRMEQAELATRHGKDNGAV